MIISSQWQSCCCDVVEWCFECTGGPGFQIATQHRVGSLSRCLFGLQDLGDQSTFRAFFGGFQVFLLFFSRGTAMAGEQNGVDTDLETVAPKAPVTARRIAVIGDTGIDRPCKYFHLHWNFSVRVWAFMACVHSIDEIRSFFCMCCFLCSSFAQKWPLEIVKFFCLSCCNSEVQYSF